MGHVYKVLEDSRERKVLLLFSFLASNILQPSMRRAAFHGVLITDGCSIWRMDTFWKQNILLLQNLWFSFVSETAWNSRGKPAFLLCLSSLRSSQEGTMISWPHGTDQNISASVIQRSNRFEVSPVFATSWLDDPKQISQPFCASGSSRGNL